MQIQVNASKREDQGSGASRRLRRAGKLPGIIYGGGQDATPITLDHNDLYHMLQKEAFHASILTIDVDGAKQSAVLRDTQWHAYKPQVLHIDFQRVAADEKIHLRVPLHFVNDDICPGVKLEGGMVSHVMTELDVQCLPKDLPEYIEVDLKDLSGGKSLHVSELAMPAGVEVVHHGEGDPIVATVLKTGGGEGGEEGEEGEGGEQA
ncbi:MAG: 50S ribosomal protein L25/general stress protein Ctc [Rhodocyclaceae bacterium]|nr:50S ribosomal protein L25/general stress protein Ctc [Rhodocyclaceae bacterium]